MRDMEIIQLENAEELPNLWWQMYISDMTAAEISAAHLKKFGFSPANGWQIAGGMIYVPMDDE